ncbi:MAG: putative rRNA maturation factor [Pelagibacterales bacterium]|nr:putative rRNA maturation factor [Pelagibacterales bacterium]
MINVNIISDYKFWNNKLKKADIFFNKLIKCFPLKYQFKDKKVDITVLLSHNKNIKKLNKKFRNKNKHTDILSFPFDQKPFFKKKIYLGDIIISYEHINKPKSLTSIQFKKKVIKIFIHGFLHLLNYDHIKLKDFKKMFREEEKIYNLLSKKLEKFI